MLRHLVMTLCELIVYLEDLVKLVYGLGMGIRILRSGSDRISSGPDHSGPGNLDPGNLDPYRYTVPGWFLTSLDRFRSIISIPVKYL